MIKQILGSKLRSSLFIIAATVWWCTSHATAACTGTSPNRFAASVNWNDVNDCVTAASSGDTVHVPAGSSTWSSSINVAKDLTILGAGKTSTRITMNGTCFNIDNGATTRISGFGFTNCNFIFEGDTVAGKTHRVDYNSFQSVSPWITHEIWGGCPSVLHVTGLWDHNDFKNYAVHVNGTPCPLRDDSSQHHLWAQDPPFGSNGGAQGVVYIEDNTFTGDVGTQNYVDGNYGARFVVRFNTSNAADVGSIDIHSVQGANRAVQVWEIYKNTFTKTNQSFYPLAFVRGGSGVIWGNRLSAAYTNDILLDNVRSCSDPGDGVGKCNGSSNWDQNTPGQGGYGCRDQVGRWKDDSLWAPGQPFTQTLTPAYFWDNLKGTSTQVAVVINAGDACLGPGGDANAAHLRANRDWYTQNLSFDGTSGVGVGTLANRPTSCTAGVAYWATDQGEWNSVSYGPDGQLYKCTAPNTWSLYYTPYTYPHPLQVGSATTTQLAPPTNLRAIGP
jgi:hypothetical protein